jgi:hypothetical protein
MAIARAGTQKTASLRAAQKASQGKLLNLQAEIRTVSAQRDDEDWQERRASEQAEHVQAQLDEVSAYT